RQLPSLRERLSVGDDVADEADFLCLGGFQMSAGKEDVGCDSVRNLAAQSHGRSRERKQAPSHFRDTEARALAGNADVGGLENFRTACNRGALDGGDQRLGQSESLQQRLDDARVQAASIAL